MRIFSQIKNFFTPEPEIDFQLALREETFSRNYEKAASLYQKAVDRGHSKAKYFLAIMYLDGRGVNKDISKAIELLTEASDAGYDKAKKMLSDIKTGKYVIL
jgi:TPR repeat protein